MSYFSDLEMMSLLRILKEKERALISKVEKDVMKKLVLSIDNALITNQAMSLIGKEQKIHYLMAA